MENGARFAMACAGIGQLGVNIPAQSTYYHTIMKHWNISTIMHVLCNTLLILLGEASNLLQLVFGLFALFVVASFFRSESSSTTWSCLFD